MRKRQIAGGSLWLLLGASLNLACTLGVFGVLSRTLDRATFGVYRQVWTIGSTLALFLTLGIPVAILYFVPQLHRAAGRARTLLRGQLLLVLGGAVGALLVFSFPGAISWLFRGNRELEPCLRHYWPALLFFPIGLRVTTLCMSLERPALAGKMNGLFMLLGATAIVATQAFRRDLPALFVAQGVAGGVFFLLSSALLLRQARRTGEGEIQRLSGAGALPESIQQRGVGVGRIFQYALPLMLGDILSMASGLISRLVIAWGFSSAAYAVFANGALELPIALMLVQAVFTMIQPQLVRHYINRETAAFVQLWNSAAANIAVIVFPVSCLLALLSGDIMVVLFGPAYADSGPIFLLYCVSMATRIQSPDSVINATGRTKYILFFSLFAMGLNLAAALVGLRLGGMLGVAVAVMLQRFVITGAQAWLCCRLVGVRFVEGLPWRVLGRTALAALAVTAACAWVPWLPLPPLLRILAAAAVYLPLYYVLARRFGLIRQKHLDVAREFLGKILPL